MSSALEQATLDTLTPARIASLIERSQFSHASIVRGLKWAPQANDVVVSSPPQCGQLLLTKMIRMLLAKGQAQMAEAAAGSTPWVESRDMDQACDALTDPQPWTRRVFRTCMSHDALAPRIAAATGAKFVTIVRHPKDLREVWYKNMRQFTIDGFVAAEVGSVYEVAYDFDERFTSSDFAAVPVTIVHDYADAGSRPSGGSNKREKEFQSREADYEHNLAQWVAAAAANDTQVLVVFLEELLARPEQVLDRLAAFLHATPDAAKCDEILLHTTGVDLLNSKMLANETLTLDQSRFLKFRFAFSHDEDHPRLDLLDMMKSANNVSGRGVFSCENLDQQDGGGGVDTFTADTCDAIKAWWKSAGPKNVSSYEELYCNLTKEAYPAAYHSTSRSPKASFSPLTMGRKMLGKSLSRLRGSSDDLASRSFRLDSEDSTGSTPRSRSPLPSSRSASNSEAALPHIGDPCASPSSSPRFWSFKKTIVLGV
jgi:hypothetical protein